MKTLLILFLTLSSSQCFTLEEGLRFLTGDLDFDISLTCSNQLLELQQNLKNPESNYWGAKMIDASSKVQSGIMSFATGDLGNFDQCINTKGRIGKDEIMGKYCLGYLSIDAEEMAHYVKFLDEHVNEPMLIRKKSSIITNLAVTENNSMIQGPTWAGCFPNGCTTDDINNIVNKVVKKFIDTNATIVFTDMYCQTKQDVYPRMSTGGTITMVFFWAYLTILGTCTLYDVSFRWLIQKPYQSIAAFSIVTNIKKLFEITEDQNQMSCLNGLRVISMLWVVLAHQYSITCTGPIVNTMDLVQWASFKHSMYLISGTMAVDTFLVIGALLITTGFLRRKHEGRPVPIHKYYFHRYIRLTPALAAMVLFSSTILTHLGSGPRWPAVKPYFQDNCANYWWSTLLYIQNYVNVRNMCVGQTWYLSIDMQLFVISPVILTCLHKWPRKTLYFICFCVCAVIGFSLFVALTNELTAILSNPFGNLENFSNKYYLLTHTRAAPWFIGLILGYYIHKYQIGEISFNMKACYSGLGWVICMAIFSFCVLVGHATLRDQEYHKWGNALHIAFIRPFWSLAICWVIVACIAEIGPISEKVNKFLSFRYFQILNRFNYSIYLIHVTMMYMISFERKFPVYFSDFEMVQRFWGSLFFSFVLAFLWILMFESPLITLEKVLSSTIHRPPLTSEDSGSDDESSSSTDSEPTATTSSHRDQAPQIPQSIYLTSSHSSEPKAGSSSMAQKNQEGSPQQEISTILAENKL